MVAPKMMFVSSVAAWRITSAASLTSISDRSLAAGDREQDAARADDLGVDQRRAQRALRRLARAILGGARVADAHQGGAGVAS